MGNHLCKDELPLEGRIHTEPSHGYSVQPGEQCLTFIKVAFSAGFLMLHGLPFLLQEELQLLWSTSPTPSSGSAPPGFPSTSCVYRLSKELVFTQPSFVVRELPLDQSRNLREHPESKRTKSHKETSSKERCDVHFPWPNIPTSRIYKEMTKCRKTFTEAGTYTRCCL